MLWSRRVSTDRGKRIVKEIFASLGTDPPPNDPPRMVEVYAELICTQPEMMITCAHVGWQLARDVLCEFAGEIIMEGKPLPPWLREFVVWAMRNPGKAPPTKGPDPFTNVHRDFSIATVVRMLVEEGFRATRSGKAECACSIVAKALQGLGIHTSEKNVTRIWRATNKGTDVTALLSRQMRTSLVVGLRQHGIDVVIPSYEEAILLVRQILAADRATPFTNGAEHG